MVQWQGAHDLWKAQIGDEYPPMEVTVTEEMVERNAWATDNYHPWYMEGSPFGGRIVSPTVLVSQLAKLFYGHYAYPTGGAFHAKQEFEFINPHRIGKKVTITGKLVDRYVKRGRDYFVSEYLVIDKDGTEIIRMRRSDCAPVVARLEEGSQLRGSIR